MKKLTFILVTVLVQFHIVQGQSKTQELGLAYSGNNYFGVRYKIGTEKFLLRLTVLNIGGSDHRDKDGSTLYKSVSGGIGLNLGAEKQISIFDDVDFYYGADILSSYGSSMSSHSGQIVTLSGHKDYTAGLGCVLGFRYTFSKHVNLSAEIIPSAWYTLDKYTESNGTFETTDSSHSFGYGFNRFDGSYANLTLSFRFRPKEEK